MVRAEPCFNCGARGSCRHREVEDVELAPMRPVMTGKGNLNSPWGKKGNPAGKARQRILDALKAQLGPL
jgi:hypothetical protein